jgi:hypothetical protein
VRCIEWEENLPNFPAYHYLPRYDANLYRHQRSKKSANAMVIFKVVVIILVIILGFFFCSQPPDAIHA